MKYSLLHLGCQMNQSDAERVKTVIEGLGYEPTESEDEADLLGVVACSVRQKAIDRVYGRISTWNSWKARRPLLTFVTGCILPADREKFADLFDISFDITELPQLAQLISQSGVVIPLPVPRDLPAQGFWGIPASYSSSFEAYVPIQNGCDKYCTFCAVPYTRGREVSRPSEEVVQEVTDLVARGYKSITLLGQNVNSYGRDRPGAEMTFTELLASVAGVCHTAGREVWVYFTSPHPRDMTEGVLRVIADSPSLAKQIHLPLQSGDDKILLKMNRTYEVEDYRRTVRQIREILPRATLFTDIIVGFSGETEEQFENTRSVMREFAYNMAYIAQYSPRPGAASFRWPDDVPHEEKSRRLHLLNEVLTAGSGAYNAALVGRTARALVEGPDRKPAHLAARTEGRIPLRIRGADTGLVGSFVDVRIVAAASLSLEGELLETPPVR